MSRGAGDGGFEVPGWRETMQQAQVGRGEPVSGVIQSHFFLL